MRVSKSLFYIIVLFVVLSACRTTKPILDELVVPINKEAFDSVLSQLPDYSESLHAVSGSGRAIVSEPGNSDRVTLEFETDTTLSLITIKNRIGIVGAVMLVDQDSILIYNKIDKVSQKISAVDNRLTSLNELASINLLDLLNYKIKLAEVAFIENRIEDKTTTVIYFRKGGYALVSGDSKLIEYVERPRSSGLPYAAIRYENYAKVDGYTLPRKITILSADEVSKVTLQIRSLSINPGSLSLVLEIPKDIPIERL